MQASGVSTSPVIARTRVRVCWPNVPRNMDDEMLLALKKNGGVMQIVGLRGYVKVAAAGEDGGAAGAAAGVRQPVGAVAVEAAAGVGALQQPDAGEARRVSAPRDEIEAKWPSANVADFVNHIDHAVKLDGIDHVGISSDFDGGGGSDRLEQRDETFNGDARAGEARLHAKSRFRRSGAGIC